MQVVTKYKPRKKNINIVFRCGEQKYLDAMVEKGQIHFGIISNWINDKVFNSDNLEGAFRFAPADPNIKRDYEFFSSKGVLFARNKKVNYSFGFCVFGIGDDDFQNNEEIDENGNLYRCCYLERTYLEPYKIVPTINEYLFYKSNDKMKLVYITHPEIFIKEIEKELVRFGFEESEILYGPVVYVDKYNSNAFESYPASLFYKHIDYTKENEIRVVIVSNRKNVIDKFVDRGCNIEIGNIERYAKVIDYPYEDIQIKKEKNRIVFDTPNQFFLRNRSKSTLDLCETIIKHAKKGVWNNKRQGDEIEIVKKILWERDGIFANISLTNDNLFETQFINANPKIDDKEFQEALSKIWSKIN